MGQAREFCRELSRASRDRAIRFARRVWLGAWFEIGSSLEVSVTRCLIIKLAVAVPLRASLDRAAISLVAGNRDRAVGKNLFSNGAKTLDQAPSITLAPDVPAIA